MPSLTWPDMTLLLWVQPAVSLWDAMLGNMYGWLGPIGSLAFTVSNQELKAYFYMTFTLPIPVTKDGNSVFYLG